MEALKTIFTWDNAGWFLSIVVLVLTYIVPNWGKWVNKIALKAASVAKQTSDASLSAATTFQDIADAVSDEKLSSDELKKIIADGKKTVKEFEDIKLIIIPKK